VTTDLPLITATVVQHLAAALGDVYAVGPMVDNFESYRLAHPNGAILVHYFGSTFSGANNIPIRQDITLDIYVVGRTIHGPQGVWAVNRMVHDALWGWRPVPADDVVDPAQADAAPRPPRQRAGRMYPVREQMVAHSPSQWQYVLSYAFSAPIHAEHDTQRSTPS
jgi:hypothetical protein